MDSLAADSLYLRKTTPGIHKPFSDQCQLPSDMCFGEYAQEGCWSLRELGEDTNIPLQQRCVSPLKSRLRRRRSALVPTRHMRMVARHVLSDPQVEPCRPPGRPCRV